ncbi:MAG: exosortase/archaeosortase family protein [Armatimonadetes bacterium]|nr:exosortase/archaeosortase family protein [Armatimonadota bacterium]
MDSLPAAQTRPLPSPQATDQAPSLIQVITVGAALLLAYGHYILWMVERWWESPYYGHGFLIPIISGYLIWRLRERLWRLPREDFSWGIIIVAGSLVVHLAASFADVHFPSGFALVGTIFGLVVWLGGRAWGRMLIFPVGFLAFMVPLGRILVEQVAGPLQLLSAQLGGRAVAMIGGMVSIEGTLIRTPIYTFEVAIPCSGLKSTIAMTALAALFAYLVVAPRWKKLVLFACAFPVALLANTARIFVTVILGTTVGPAAAEGFFHSVSGVIVFLFGLTGLFIVGRILGCLQLREDIW